jgi:lysophospholipase L1-like esterase
MLSRWLRLGCATFVAVALVLVPAGAYRTSADSGVGPKAYYLALGDSWGEGYQPNGDLSHGYPQQWYTNDLSGQGVTQFVNYSCGGETTTSFLQGNCPSTPPYSGTQLSAAMTFLAQHRGQVSPVTIDIGGNDLLNLLPLITSNPQQCFVGLSTDTVKALVKAVATFDVNYTIIMGQLRAALGGSGDLLTMAYPDPYQNICPVLLPIVERFNADIRTIAQQHGAKVAPVFATFGGSTVPNRNLCTYTWICSSYHDIHPTTTGYHVIARTFQATAGY